MAISKIQEGDLHELVDQLSSYCLPLPTLFCDETLEHEHILPEEEDLILRLHHLLGNILPEEEDLILMLHHLPENR